jgi:hypothetical protein
MKRIHSQLILVIILSSLCRLYANQPMHIEFAEMIKRSKLIVIANTPQTVKADALISNTFELNVISVLKGQPFTGAYQVNPATGTIHVDPGATFIAFINENNGFEWYGLPTKTDKTTLNDHDVLMLAGFYDFNAYLVSPCTITLAQLKTYLKEKTYQSQTTGYLHCFSSITKKMEPTPIQISVNYTYSANKISSTATITGLKWADFTASPQISVSAWRQEIDLEYETNGYRAFTLKGEIMPQPDAKGNQQAMFWVTQPEELSLEELETYLSNEIHGFPYFEMEVITDRNDIYPMILGKEMGTIGTLLYQSKKLNISNYNEDPYWPREIILDYNSTHQLVIKLDSLQATPDQLKFSYEKLIRELKANPIKGIVALRDHQAHDTFLTGCVLRYVTTRFTKNVNYGK